MATSHGLGVGRGSMIDHGNGIVEYRPTGKLFPAFRVNISDVTGFSVRRATPQDKKSGGAKMLQEVLVLQGGGTELASAPVNYGTAEKIEAWIRAHPMFRGSALQPPPGYGPPQPPSGYGPPQPPPGYGPPRPPLGYGAPQRPPGYGPSQAPPGYGPPQLPTGETGVARNPGSTADQASAGLADQLRKLAELRQAGALSEEEFQQAKAKLLQ